MSSDNHTIASQWARMHLHNAVHLGANAPKILTVAGLPAEVLQAPKARISAQQLAVIVRAAWLAGDDELLGLTTSKIKVGVFALLAKRLVTCKTLQEVLRETVTFYNLINDSVQFEFTQSQHQAHVCLQVQHSKISHDVEGGFNYGETMIIELLLLVWHRFPSWLVGQVIPLLQVNFKFSRPSYSQEYRLMFPCQCEFNCPRNELVFDARFLSMPVIQSQTQLKQYLADIPLQWFRKQAFHESVTAQVVRMLEECEELQSEGIDAFAKQLHMTSRTLRRKLTHEGSAFQALKDHVRRDKAIHFLNEGTMSMAEVARRIGFTEAAAFSRAFKQWTGLAPAMYRKTLKRIS